MAGRSYATTDELDAYLTDSPYELVAPPIAVRMLRRASELINTRTRKAAQAHWTDPLPDQSSLAASSAGTLINTSAAHGLSADDLVYFTNLDGGSGLAPGSPYYVLAAGLTGTAFAVGTVVGGTAVPFTTNIVTGIVAAKTEFQDALSRATVAQVEFWLEVGEEHDVVGLTGSATVGRVNISKLPMRLAPRAADILADHGFTIARVWIR